MRFYPSRQVTHTFMNEHKLHYGDFRSALKIGIENPPSFDSRKMKMAVRASATCEGRGEMFCLSKHCDGPSVYCGSHYVVPS